MRLFGISAMRTAVGLAICSILLNPAPRALAQASPTYHLAMDHLDERIYAAGIGISSLVRVKLLPKHGIDLKPVTTSGFLESFARVNAGDVDFAVLKTDWSDMAPGGGALRAEAVGHNVRSIAELWADGEQSVQLVAGSDVDDTGVYEITKVIFEQLPFLQNIEQSFARASLDDALDQDRLPRHPGARRYFDEVALFASQPELARVAPAAGPEAFLDTAQDAKTFTIFFEFDQATLKPEGLATADEIKSFADKLETPIVWIAGYTDSTGPSDYNLTLAQKRADAVLQALQERDLNVRRIDVAALGERSPFVVTDDETREERNRRVEVLVELAPVPLAIRSSDDIAGPDLPEDRDPGRGRPNPTF